MAHVILYTAVSLDGYIARADGSVEWLSEYDSDGEDFDYVDFYRSIDCLVMGANTYRQVRSFGEWPYAGKKTFVFSSQESPAGSIDVEFVSGRVRPVLKRIETLRFKKIWLVGGRKLVWSFCEEALIDEFILTIIPILLGEGIPLFSPGCDEVNLQLIQTRKYPGGLVQLHYQKRD